MERGGRVRAQHVPDASAATLGPIMIRDIDVKNSRPITDGHRAYKMTGPEMEWAAPQSGATGGSKTATLVRDR